MRLRIPVIYTVPRRSQALEIIEIVDALNTHCAIAGSGCRSRGTERCKREALRETGSPLAETRGVLA